MFKGPVFIVGRPRSGTKLLRSLLVGHSEISIPFWQSDFIPKYIYKVKDFGDLSDPKNFSLFFDFFKNIEFFKMIKEDPAYSDIVDREKWYHAIEVFSYGGAIEAFYKLYAKCEKKQIWGDKSPHYMLNIKMLRELFPQAKFIHIIRDVRDNCLSNVKAWGKNPYRAAQLWADAISKCRADAALFLDRDYHELTYESLLDNTENELTQICNFLNISYEKNMMILESPPENIGDTKHSMEVVKNNKEKWRTKMSDQMIAKIESISFDLLNELNYDISFAKKSRRLGSLEMTIARVSDGWNRFIFDCRFQGGLVKAVLYQYNKRRYG